jgi:hypothetical protein
MDNSVSHILAKKLCFLLRKLKLAICEFPGQKGIRAFAGLSRYKPNKCLDQETVESDPCKPRKFLTHYQVSPSDKTTFDPIFHDVCGFRPRLFILGI